MPFSKDGKRYLQFRLEGYNAFNKTPWSGINTGATLQGGSTIAAALANNTIVNLPTAVAAQGPTPNTNGSPSDSAPPITSARMAAPTAWCNSG